MENKEKVVPESDKTSILINIRASGYPVRYSSPVND